MICEGGFSGGDGEGGLVVGVDREGSDVVGEGGLGGDDGECGLEDDFDLFECGGGSEGVIVLV